MYVVDLTLTVWGMPPEIRVIVKFIADALFFQYEEPSLDDLIILRGHQLSVTCTVISPDKRHVFSGSKDCSIIKCKSGSKYWSSTYIAGSLNSIIRCKSDWTASTHIGSLLNTIIKCKSGSKHWYSTYIGSSLNSIIRCESGSKYWYSTQIARS